MIIKLRSLTNGDFKTKKTENTVNEMKLMDIYMFPMGVGFT